MPLPLALIADGLMTVAPMILQYFSGEGGDDAAAAKIKSARDGLAARISEAERIPLAKAQAMVDEQLKPMIEQHMQESGGNAASMVAGIASGIGAARLGGRLMGGAAKLGKAAKAVAGAEKVAAPAVAAAESVATSAAPAAAEAIDDSALTAKAAARADLMKRAQAGELDRVTPARQGPPPRIGYDEPLEAELVGRPRRASAMMGEGDAIDAEVDASLTPREPSPSPRAYMTRERFNAPFDDPSPMATDRFVMGDPEPRGIDYDPQAQIMREMQREAALRKLRSLIRPGD